MNFVKKKKKIIKGVVLIIISLVIVGLPRSVSMAEIEKEKLSSIGDGESCGDGGGGGSGGAGGVSASLTPTIWDKTIPYDGENFHLEYMDLDEFLLENQIPAALEEELHKSLEQEAQGSPAVPEVSAAVPQVPGETEKAAEVQKIKGEDESEIAEAQVMENATGEHTRTHTQKRTQDLFHKVKPLFIHSDVQDGIIKLVL